MTNDRTPIVLWDVDGTLLRAPGLGPRAFRQAVAEVTGSTWDVQPMELAGRTDRYIALRLLEQAGVPDPALVPAVLAAAERIYTELAGELARVLRVLPGIPTALTTLGERGAVQTLVTGNLRPIAEAKVTTGGLEHHLRLELGGYGSDEHTERAELVRHALDRLQRAGATAASRDVWVVGDTEQDFACADANGVRCALVATGSCTIDELNGLGADLVVADLADPTPLLDAIAG